MQHHRAVHSTTHTHSTCNLTQQYIAQHSTTQFHIAPQSTTQHHTAPHSTTQHRRAPHRITEHHSAPHSITQDHTAPHSIRQHHTASHSITQHQLFCTWEPAPQSAGLCLNVNSDWPVPMLGTALTGPSTRFFSTPIAIVCCESALKVQPAILSPARISILVTTSTLYTLCIARHSGHVPDSTSWPWHTHSSQVPMCSLFVAASQKCFRICLSFSSFSTGSSVFTTPTTTNQRSIHRKVSQNKTHKARTYLDSMGLHSRWP
jgi:hypothetical protein